MDLKYFDAIDGAWYDVSGNTGSGLEYDGSGWVTTGGYKKYVAQITQSSTDAPVAIVLENTLGFIPDWKYDSNGVYGFDWDGDFDTEKCVYYLGTTHNGKVLWIDYLSTYDITLQSQDGDGNITQTTLEIRYYN